MNDNESECQNMEYETPEQTEESVLIRMLVNENERILAEIGR